MATHNSAKLEVSTNHVGIVFGSKGSFRTKVEADTGVKIEFDQTTKSNRFPVFHISGKLEQRERAKAMIADRIQVISQRAAESVVRQTYQHQSRYNANPVASLPKVKTATRSSNRFGPLMNYPEDSRKQTPPPTVETPPPPQPTSNSWAVMAEEANEPVEMTIDQYLLSQKTHITTKATPPRTEHLSDERRPIGVPIKREVLEPIVGTSGGNGGSDKTSRRRSKPKSQPADVSFTVGHSSKIKTLRHQNWIRRQDRELKNAALEHDDANTADSDTDPTNPRGVKRKIADLDEDEANPYDQNEPPAHVSSTQRKNIRRSTKRREAAAATDLAEQLNTIKISDKPQEPHTATRDDIEQNIFQQGFASHWEGHVVPHDYTNPCNLCMEQFCSKECFESYLFIDSLK